MRTVRRVISARLTSFRVLLAREQAAVCTVPVCSVARERIAYLENLLRNSDVPFVEFSEWNRVRVEEF